MSVPEISVEELAALRKSGARFLLLDVREEDEFEAANLGGTLLPLAELPERIGELDPATPIVVHCHHGGRSAQATEFLLRRGFRDVRNLTGGIDAWSLEIDPSVPRY